MPLSRRDFIQGAGTLAAAGAVQATGQELQPVIDVGCRKQLFMDERLIETSRGVQLTTNLPYVTDENLVPGPGAFAADESSHVWFSGTVRREEGKTRLWYQTLVVHRPPPAGYRYQFQATHEATAYAESSDGIHFTLPELNRHPYRDARIKNIVAPDIRSPSVWLDPRATPEHRYRSQCKGAGGKLDFYSSPDGIRWRPTHSVAIGDCDTQSIVFWDSSLERYVLYTRRWIRFQGDSEKNFRTHRRLESKNLIEWNNDVTVLQADAADLAIYKTATGQPPLDFYGATVFKYPDEQGLYVMLAMAFWHWYLRDANAALHEKLGPDTFDVRLAAGRDGQRFTRLGGRRPFIPQGPPGSFGAGMIWVLPNPIVMGDQIWIYVAGINMEHNGNIDPAAGGQVRTGIGRAILRLDGFVSADAPYEGGEFVTVPLRHEGDTLELNLDTSGGGYAQVELLDEGGKPIPGYTRAEASLLCGNSVKMPVSWGTRRSVGSLAGKLVRLRCYLRDSKLYAFQFRKTA